VGGAPGGGDGGDEGVEGVEPTVVVCADSGSIVSRLVAASTPAGALNRNWRRDFMDSHQLAADRRRGGTGIMVRKKT
jgi:hypothetical protein